MEESFCRINIGWEEKDQCFNTWTIGPTLNIDFVVIIVDFRLHSTLGRKTQFEMLLNIIVVFSEIRLDLCLCVFVL